MTRKFVYLLLVIPAAGMSFHSMTGDGISSTVDHSGITRVVISSADSGPGTLRQCLADAGNGDIITFDPAIFPPSSPASILLNSPLPFVTQGNLTIDAGNAGVILDGTNIAAGAAGLAVDSDSNTVMGLQVLHFPANGILLTSAAGHNTVEGNVISGNGGRAGLEISGSNNVVRGNLIGTDISGSAAMGNENHGIYIGDASNNDIGPGNIIAHNGGSGIEVEGIPATGNTITRNSITQNAMEGIRLSNGGNTELPAPVITACTDTSVSGTASADCTIEIFSDPGDEGMVYEGTTGSDSLGAFAFTKSEGLTGLNITATATDSTGNTSEFSAAANVAIEPATWGTIKARFTD